ncbi:MAG TPA: hypothetical protein PKA05_18155 [Roseiflexaceae bacterium]|nr:hypothetical protein [Roseiflexaceae bacterium]HMP42306.1 hypothetical protein [Roseiflexaceae bacterium]
MTVRPGPKFTGVDTYRDPQGRFQFRYPSDWIHYPLQGAREGAMYSPQSQNPQTWYAVWITRLEYEVVAEDFEILAPNVRKGLEQLPDLAIEAQDDFIYGNLIKFDRTFTFRDGDAVRKQHMWLMYVSTWQIVAAFQGETVEEYEYWLPMGNYSFQFFTIPHELWFAADRDLNKPGASPKKPRVPRGAAKDQTKDA